MMRRLSSLRVSCAALAAVVLCVVAAQNALLDLAWICLPLLVLAVNLTAALLCNPVLRRRKGLALFHVALVLGAALTGAHVLTEFEGRVELAEGQVLAHAGIATIRRGLLCDCSDAGIALLQGPIDVQFTQGMNRQATRSVVRMDGEAQRVLSDTVSMETSGWRVSTSANKGFAALVEWRAHTGERVLGVVNFPSYPAAEWKQEQVWHTPAGEALRLAVEVPAHAAEMASWSMRDLLPGVKIFLHRGAGVHALEAGRALPVEGGSVLLREVRLWMGYRIVRQPLLAWMALVAFAGIAGLALDLTGGAGKSSQRARPTMVPTGESHAHP